MAIKLDLLATHLRKIKIKSFYKSNYITQYMKSTVITFQQFVIKSYDVVETIKFNIRVKQKLKRYFSGN